MATVYVETTIPSYLTAWTSRDLVRAAHQQITREWWQTARDQFEMYVSEAVIQEIALGDANAAADRQGAVKDLPVLTLTDAVLALAREYDTALRLPPKATTDVLHIAFAVAYEMDYLVTWNCRHIASGPVIRRLQDANDLAGRKTPLIVTPEALLEDEL
jgi:predicted nucleic acid-binding protein